MKAQVSPERSAWSNLSKQRWERTDQQVRRLLSKDSLNATARYVMAQYFFTPANPTFQVDSAYYYTVTALRDFEHSSSRERERMKRFPLDSLILVGLRMRVDSAAFSRAKTLNSEKAYSDFLRLFPTAGQRSQAVELRNEAAYQAALKENSHQAFQQYMLRYPESVRIPEAKALYEKLLFEAMTSDKRLASYENFLRECPSTPYRGEVERAIFEISTAPGTIASFEHFLKQYPESREASHAKSIFFHLLTDEQQLRALPEVLQNDSIARVVRAEQRYLVPVLHGNVFGFMDSAGEEVMRVGEDELDKRYLCGNIDEDVLIVQGKLVARSGALIYKGEVSAADDIGQGFLLIEDEKGCTKVIHKSGFILVDSCVEDARILAGKFLALKKNSRWALSTFAGKLLFPFTWNDLSVVGDVIIFTKEGRSWLATVAQVARIADQEPLKLKDPFDEVKLWPDGRIWARAGKYQGVFDQQLNTYLPFKDDEQFTPSFFGALARQSQGWTMYDETGGSAGSYDTVVLSKPWAAVRSSGTWRLMVPANRLHPISTYDSVFFAGPFAVGLRKDSAYVHFNKQHRWRGVQPVHFEFVPGQDSSAFLLMESAGKKTVFRQDGKKLFITDHERVQHAGGNIFIVSKKEKKGLLSVDGKLILPMEYDAIGSPKDGTISLLKAGKFGLYDVNRKKLIKPEYSKNLIRYNGQVIAAYKNGTYGFIGWDGKPVSAFEFAEIRHWSDSVALVKKNFQWMLYNIGMKKTVLDKVKDYKLIRDKPEEKLAIVHRENTYGVINSRRGIVIPTTFTDIVNVGSADEPLYFTEKHVEEASIFVVIYYNSEGKMLRKEIYEQDEYDKIYCSGK